MFEKWRVKLWHPKQDHVVYKQTLVMQILFTPSFFMKVLFLYTTAKPTFRCHYTHFRSAYDVESILYVIANKIKFILRNSINNLTINSITPYSIENYIAYQCLTKCNDGKVFFNKLYIYSFKSCKVHF